jgi:L-ascorbate metabolism protein UlaG (beta-lactamase superfamily)
VELPLPAADIVASVDAVLVSHLHADHFDATAASLIGDRLPVLCQPDDAEELRRRGVTWLVPVDDDVTVGDVRVARTGGRHGVGALADALGPVSGFVLAAPGATIYVAGDTIWCEEVAAALRDHPPDVVVVNAGGARFTGSERLIMDAGDVAAVCAAAPDALVVAVHLEAINHCPITRAELRGAVDGLNVVVPEDGEIVALDPPDGGATAARAAV